ncbi:MAG TPA: hypothetical protein VME68_01700 [Acidobacteriaceae bacterium]|nr:hypothetical protein [Acidobacteriaceae bacterium]
MPSQPDTTTTPVQNAARVALGVALAASGVSHLTVGREAFKGQVPAWLPLDPETVVLQSGIVEIALGSALVLSPRQKALVGRLTAAFFVAVFPGNLAQWRSRSNAFGLDTDSKRFARLLFQPPFIAWAIWSTGACARKLRSRGTGTANL